MSTIRLSAACSSISAAVPCSLALVVLATPSLQQETRPSVAETAAPAEPQEQALTDESRERVELIRLALRQGDGESAREVLRETMAGLPEPHAGEESSHIAFLLELDRLARELGSLEESRHACEAVLAMRERLLPPDDPDLLGAKQSLATVRAELGDLAGARELFEVVLEARTRILPADHPDLLAAMQNLAWTLHELGDLAGARVLEEAALASLTRLLPADDTDLLTAQQSLAATRYGLGDLAGANELFEAVHETSMRMLPADHPALLDAKGNLAATRKALGDLAGARELEEVVLEARKRLLPADDPDLLRAKQNLAATRVELGDLAGARELFEAVLEARTRLLPADHPDLLTAKANVASVRYELGDFAGAKELFEIVLEARKRFLPADHPKLLMVKQRLAVTKAELGDLTGARELEEEVLAIRTRLLAADHPDLLASKANLAATKSELGDLAGARELFETVLAAWTRVLPPDHADLLKAQANLAVTRAALGDLAGSRELVSRMLAGVRVRAGMLRAEAARPARESARAELQRLSDALFEHALDAELFDTLESLRVASVSSAETANALGEDPELACEAHGIAEIRGQLNDLVAAGPEDENATERWREDLLRLTEQRDLAERGLRRKLAEVGTFVGEIDAEAVIARIPNGAALVSFLRRSMSGETTPSVDSLLAFVVRPGGGVRRVELGPTAELETLVGQWRAALGRPLAERGIGGTRGASDGADLDALGVELRKRILDPILALAGEVRTLHLVLDDVLFLLPLDALPYEGGLVGERLTIRNEVTLARLLRDPRRVPPEGGLVLAGSLDYDAEVEASANVSPDASTPPLESSLDRAGSPSARFIVLPGTTAELESIRKLYSATFERDATALTGALGTKAALLSAAPGSRFLHLATHGWFASESFKSQLDSLAEQGSREAFQRAEQTLTGFAPETLCGLALAGANRGKDALGRVPGILTAEELATFDLRNCELAVLSACETNVGIRRAGQGIQSLQTALHAAGARTAITSLWKVDDAATRRLFEHFYTKLWKEKLGKAGALWQAKMALRAEGHPPRDWAGWILSGDPD